MCFRSISCFVLCLWLSSCRTDIKEDTGHDSPDSLSLPIIEPAPVDSSYYAEAELMQAEPQIGSGRQVAAPLEEVEVFQSLIEVTPKGKLRKISSTAYYIEEPDTTERVPYLVLKKGDAWVLYKIGDVGFNSTISMARKETGDYISLAIGRSYSGQIYGYFSNRFLINTKKFNYFTFPDTYSMMENVADSGGFVIGECFAKLNLTANRITITVKNSELDPVLCGTNAEYHIDGDTLVPIR